MASFSYDRKYTLTVEIPPEIIPPEDKYQNTPLEDASIVVTNKDDYRTIIIEQAVQITDLQIKATVNFKQKSTGKDPVNATIEIYNLSPATINQIVSVNGVVVLEAGYGDEQAIIFTGQVFKSTVVKNGKDVVTTLQCKDGFTPLYGTLYSKTFSKGTPYSEIFQDLVAEFARNGINSSSSSIILDVPSKIPLEAPSELKTVKSWSFSGYLRESLDVLCKSFNYTWKIIHSRLYIYPEGYQDMVGEMTFNPDNILSVRPDQDGVTEPSSSPNKKGIFLRAFLDGDIDESKILVIEADEEGRLEEFAGRYKVIDVKHELDYEGKAWYTEVRASGVET